MRWILVISLALHSLALGGFATVDASCGCSRPMESSCCGASAEFPAASDCAASGSMQAAMCGCSQDTAPATTSNAVALVVNGGADDHGSTQTVATDDLLAGSDLTRSDLLGSSAAPLRGGRDHNRQCALLGVWRT